MENNETNRYQKKIITIPNILSVVRLLLLPIIVWIYLGLENHILASAFIVLSCITDIVDGFIARKFNMISDLGKVLDPFADKLTQGVLLIILAVNYPLMLIPIIAIVIKEIFMVCTGYLVVRKCDIVLGSNWHGKAATATVIGTIYLHFVWGDIHPIVSLVTIIISTALVVLSLALYAVRNFEYLLGKKI